MSDLLPLVAAVLNDKAAADAPEELIQLREELAISRSVEIIRTPGEDVDEDDDDDDEVIVYASAQFQDGDYGGNPNFWHVDLEHKTACRLADLRDCSICVGGGIQIESLNDELSNRAGFEGFLDHDDGDHGGDNSKAVHMCFCPNAMWLTFVVHGWPRAEWEAASARDENGVEPWAIMHHLVEIVAENHPNATVEFKDVSLKATTVHGAIKRLLSPRRQEQVRDGRVNQEEHSMSGFVAGVMRRRGNENTPARFVPQVNQVMAILTSGLQIREIHGNEDFITFVIAQYEVLGHDDIEGILRAGLVELDRRETARLEGETTAEAAEDRDEDMDQGDGGEVS